MRSDNKVYPSKFTLVLFLIFAIQDEILFGIECPQCCFFFFFFAFLVNKETLFHMKENTRQDVWLFFFSFHFLYIENYNGVELWEDLIIKILKSTLDFWVPFLFVLPTCHAQDRLSMSTVPGKVVGLGLSYFETVLHCAIKTTQYICVFLQHFLTHMYFYNIFYLTRIFIILKKRY